MQCELCGAESLTLKKVMVENTPMMVCGKCKSLGKNPAKKVNVKKRGSFQSNGFAKIKILKKDHSVIVKKAREARNMTQADLAAKLGMKEGEIQKVESGVGAVNEKVGSRLENFLGVSLYDVEEDFSKQEGLNFTSKKESDDGGLTLGDLMKKK